jgi:hypothetical protein
MKSSRAISRVNMEWPDLDTTDATDCPTDSVHLPWKLHILRNDEMLFHCCFASGG